MFGRPRYLPELQSSNFRLRALGERMALNAPIQGSAADILKKAMINVDAALRKEPVAKMLLTVHDELVFEVPAEKLAQAAKLNKRSYARAKWAVARTRIRISLIIRKIPLQAREKKRLIDKMRSTVEHLHALEHQARRLERRVDAALGAVAAEARRDLREHRARLREIEESSEVSVSSLKRTLTLIQLGESKALQA